MSFQKCGKHEVNRLPNRLAKYITYINFTLNIKIENGSQEIQGTLCVKFWDSKFVVINSIITLAWLEK